MSQLLALTVLIGASHCLFLAGLLLFGPSRNRRSDGCLAVLLVAWAYTMLIVGWWAEPRWRPSFLQWSHLAGTVAPIPFLFGPLLYGYISFLIQRRSWRPHDLWHLAPFLLLTVALSPFYLQTGDLKREALMALEVRLPAAHDLIFWSRSLHGLMYSIAAWRLLSRDAARPEAGSFEFLWARRLTNVSLGLYGITVALFLLDRWLPTQEGLPIGEVAMVYLALSLQALAFWRLRHGLRPARSLPVIPNESRAASRYQKSGLSREQASRVMDRLAHLMRREKLFASANLGLAGLAERLQESPHHLSQALNQIRGQTLAQYLAELRCQDAAQRLKDPAHDHLTVLAIGLRAGFGSKATFNRAFKQVLGATPSSYRRGRDRFAY